MKGKDSLPEGRQPRFDGGTIRIQGKLKIVRIGFEGVQVGESGRRIFSPKDNTVDYVRETTLT